MRSCQYTWIPVCATFCHWFAKLLPKPFESASIPSRALHGVHTGGVAVNWESRFVGSVRAGGIALKCDGARLHKLLLQGSQIDAGAPRSARLHGSSLAE